LKLGRFRGEARIHLDVRPGEVVQLVEARAESAQALNESGLKLYREGMCRNIRTLYNFEPPASNDEVRAAALQYVRKISGFTKPSQANAEAFERAVDEVAAVSAKLLQELVTNSPPKDREVEAAKRRERSLARFAA
jgi:hypothetical protein